MSAPELAEAGPDPEELAELARAVAAETGELLLSRHGQVAVMQTKSSPTDVVTEMDTAAEALIRRRILAARPGDAILGEEGGQVDGQADGRRTVRQAVSWAAEAPSGGSWTPWTARSTTCTG